VAPALEPVAILPIHGTYMLRWAMRQLYILTPTHAYAACVALPPPGGEMSPTQPVVQLVIEIAAHGMLAEPSPPPPPPKEDGSPGTGDQQQGAWG
jgi:hypothetical protein